MKRVMKHAALGVLFICMASLYGTSQQEAGKPRPTGVATPADQAFVVEYYYKAKWGHADEFITLFKKNHLPLLLKQVELGRILRVSAVAPRYHATEDGRWDYRVTLVFKNVSTVNDGFDEAGLARQLYPDQDAYKREEQRRFEILEAHWDVPVKDVDLSTK